MNGRCDKCGRELGAGESISVTGVGERCYPCFNEETAARMGVDFDDTPVQPIELADVDGVMHRFEIQSLLAATGREMIAQEYQAGTRRLPIRGARRLRGRRLGAVPAPLRQDEARDGRPARRAHRVGVAVDQGRATGRPHRMGRQRKRLQPSHCHRREGVLMG